MKTELLIRASEFFGELVTKNPTFHPTYQFDVTGQIRHHGQVFLQIRMNPTSPDHSDRLQPPHNPSVVGSIPTGATDSVIIRLNGRRSDSRRFDSIYENQN
jgi:hypothetical protein